MNLKSKGIVSKYVLTHLNIFFAQIRALIFWHAFEQSCHKAHQTKYQQLIYIL